MPAVVRREIARHRPDALRRPGFSWRHVGGACAGWCARPTSDELYDALRADNPTNRQRSIATVLINEASFEDLVNAHTEGAFTWRQLARAARSQGTVPPLRIRQINAFATSAPPPDDPYRT